MRRRTRRSPDGGQSDDRQRGSGRTETQAAAAVKEIFDIAERMAGAVGARRVWVADRERFGREARVAPLTVAGLMRARIFGERTTVLTSATLKLGGEFAPMARQVGLRVEERMRPATTVTDPSHRCQDGESGG